MSLFFLSYKKVLKFFFLTFGHLLDKNGVATLTFLL